MMNSRETLAIEREKILERLAKILEFDLDNDDKFLEENRKSETHDSILGIERDNITQSSYSSYLIETSKGRSGGFPHLATLSNCFEQFSTLKGLKESMNLESLVYPTFHRFKCSGVNFATKSRFFKQQITCAYPYHIMLYIETGSHKP